MVKYRIHIQDRYTETLFIPEYKRSFLGVGWWSDWDQSFKTIKEADDYIEYQKGNKSVFRYR